MNVDIGAFLWDNMEAAGVIGAYVSISLIVVSLLSYASSKKSGKQATSIPKAAHSFTGALLGVIPGCGGTIVAASLYKNQQLSFGGLLAAFVTTLGEGSFVLLGASDEADVAGNLQAFLLVNVVGFVVGILVGSIIDIVGIKGNLNPNNHLLKTPPVSDSKPPAFARLFVDKIGFYLILIMALFLAPGSIMALWGGSIDAIEDITVWVCIALTLTSMFYYCMHRFVLKEDCHMETHTDSKEALLDAVTDISMVITYVFLGLLVANFLIDVVVGPEAFEIWMRSSAAVVVLLAAIIGATPGCGGMIAVAVAYITIPQFPIAALLAGSVATSGDGIFPLLAENKKDALMITALSFGIALLVGFVTLTLGY